MSHPLYEVLQKLEAAHLHFLLGRFRPDSVTVIVTVVGERVELDVFDDGHLEASRFRGDESVLDGRKVLEEILRHNQP